MRREILVLLAVATIFFFASATTFQSMGIVVFAMAREFHWSEAAAGGAFLALGLSCCATALLPVGMIARIGARWTVVSGCAILAIGLFLASLTHDLPRLYLAATLFGLAFSLVANTLGIYLIATWFGERSPRMIGLYLMSGTLGGAVGPPVAEALISTSGGWRLHWVVMSAAAMFLAAMCAILIRDAAVPQDRGSSSTADASETWRYGETLLAPQFMLLAAAMVVTQGCLLTVSGVTAPHFFRLGWPGGFAAQILGLQALVGTLATGISGWLTEKTDPRLMLVGGLLAEGAGMILLAFARTEAVSYAFALVFGIGWSVTCLAITVLLIRYFGHRSGTAALSTIWMLAGIAAAGPSMAGLVADLTGSFALALAGLGVILLPISLGAFLMTPPRLTRSGGLVPRLQQD